MVSRSGGGTFGCWTLKAINRFLLNVTGGDAVVQRVSSGRYICTDSYRPGMEWEGDTPAEAVRKAFGYLPKNACHYQD